MKRGFLSFAEFAFERKALVLAAMGSLFGRRMRQVSRIKIQKTGKILQGA
jgi:hypothetical protein